MSEKTKKKFATPSFTTLPARLVKDPEIVILPAKGDYPAKELTKLTVVDGASSDYYKDVFVTASFDTTKSSGTSPLKKQRKGDFVVLYGKIEYRTYETKEGEVRVAGEMRYPRDFALAPGDWSTRETIVPEGEEGVGSGAGKEEALPW